MAILMTVPLYLTVVVTLLWPLLYAVVPTVIWGRTLGKLLMGLKVTDVNRERAGFGRVVARETIKVVCVYFTIALIFMAIQALQGGPIFHDQLCGTQVGHKPRVKLSETQKQWREFYGGK